MTVAEFGKLVGEMRYYQEKFFKAKNSLYLTKAKELEKRIDKILASKDYTYTPPNEARQKTIFNN